MIEQIGRMIDAAWALSQSPLFWFPVTVALMVWLFMAGYKIGCLTKEGRR